MELLTEKMLDIKIKDDILLGNDLSFEQKFLNHVVCKCSEEIENCEVSFYFSKKSMTICCETLIISETIAKSLLDIVDSAMKQHFFCANGLRQLGWCLHYMFHRKSLTYSNLKCPQTTDLTDFYWFNNSQKQPKTTQLTDFYWFNKSTNRSFKQKTVTQVEICNCFHCFLLSEAKNDFQ